MNAADRPSAGTVVLVWAGVFGLGALAAVLLTAVADKVWPQREADGLFGNAGLLAAVLGGGLLVSLLLATATALWVRRTGPPARLGRWFAVRAAWLVAAGAGLGVAGLVLDRVRHDRAVAAIAGTWRVETADGTALSETTFHPDGRVDSTPLIGPPDERKPHTSGYQVARDGLHVRTFDLPEPPGAGEWWEHLEFHDPDTFRIWVMGFNERGGHWYRRVR